MKRYFLIGLLIFLPFGMIRGQMAVDTSLLKIESNFLTQRKVFPLEKLHLHTDRNWYVPGEKIWFKAYLTDAATLQPVIHSRYVYVELINAQDSLINRVMIRPQYGMFYGYLFLSENIPETGRLSGYSLLPSGPLQGDGVSLFGYSGDCGPNPQ